MSYLFARSPTWLFNICHPTVPLCRGDNCVAVKFCPSTKMHHRREDRNSFKLNLMNRNNLKIAQSAASASFYNRFSQPVECCRCFPRNKGEKSSLPKSGILRFWQIELIIQGKISHFYYGQLAKREIKSHLYSARIFTCCLKLHWEQS